MDLFSPSNLPGVGMGDLASIAAFCGMLGLAATSGALVAEGAIGTIVFVIAALALLSQKADFGGSTPAALLVLGFVLVAVAARLMLELRARREAREIVGAAADAPETKQARGRVASRERWARILAAVAVAWAGAAVGFAWAEWDEAPFRLNDLEAATGLAFGLVAGAIGGDAAWRFVHGALRAGGSAVIVGVVVTITAFAANVASMYIPFVGLLALTAAALLALRLRRRTKSKYAGLRILG